MRQRAIIVDLDGTLADSPHVVGFTNDEGKTDWTAWMTATGFALPHEWCREVVHAMALSGFKIIFLTARTGDEHGRKTTDDWIQRHMFVRDYELVMRKPKDYRPDYIIKREAYNNTIEHRYDVLFALDDKKRVIDMWRSLNIPALHCADY